MGQRWAGGGSAVVIPRVGIVLRHVLVAVVGADHAPTTLTGSCGASPGIACRLVWDLSHDSQAAQVTSQFVAGPVHLLLRVIFVVLLALVIRTVVHRVINRLTERAAHTFLPQMRNGAATSRFVRSGFAARRAAHRGGRGAGATPGTVATPETVGVVGTAGQPGQPTPTEAAAVIEAEDSVPAERRAPAAGVTASAPEVAAAAAQAEIALVDERRKQRVQALGSVLRSAASVTIFSIAGVVVLGDLGINLAPLLASAGVVGIAVGFGAQNLVRDYLSGIFMLVEDQYGVGDVITVGGATGTVETVTLRITRLRDVNGIVWHVRNGTIEQVGNESQGWARAVLDFPVPYTADLTTIRTLLADTADTMWNEPVWRTVMIEKPEVWGAQQVDMTPPPTVTMRVVVKTAPLRQWEVEREMRARVKAALDAAGITPAVSDGAAAGQAS
jgi:small-conductance mechanosensitive channel